MDSISLCGPLRLRALRVKLFLAAFPRRSRHVADSLQLAIEDE